MKWEDMPRSGRYGRRYGGSGYGILQLFCQIEIIFLMIFNDMENGVKSPSMLIRVSNETHCHVLPSDVVSDVVSMQSFPRIVYTGGFLSSMDLRMSLYIVVN
ncbi:unnamed protein product [Owenia fusiformis]|uniref:Uncharacterized protein n=1 Tax=Owenia fusiformis TaxID=6347 RepID=A0A8J1XN90_OWEFU|nr:unnamed protein product [Owenia fusiformis]